MENKPALCPQCGSCRIVESTDKPEQGALVCQDCRLRFGFAPGQHPLSPLLNTLEVSVTGLRKKALSLVVRHTKEGIICKAQMAGIVYGPVSVDENAWNTFSDKLFSEAHLDKWKRNCFTMDREKFNGYSWDVMASFEKKHSILSHGFNMFPPYWEPFMKLLEPFFSAAGVPLNEYFC